MQISVPMTISDLIFSFLERAVIDLLLAIIIQLTFKQLLLEDVLSRAGCKTLEVEGLSASSCGLLFVFAGVCRYCVGYAHVSSCFSCSFGCGCLWMVCW